MDKLRPRAVPALAFLAAAALAGCQTTCPTTTYLASRVVDKGTVSTTIHEGDIFLESDGLDIRISGCGTYQVPPERQPKALCMTIAARDKSRVRFAPAHVTFVAADGSRIDVPLGSLKYQIHFRAQADGTEIPTMPVAPAVDEKLECNDGYRGGGMRTVTCHFDASLAFSGARSASKPPMERAVSESANWREYSGGVDVPLAAGGRFTLLLPSMDVNGREQRLPTLEMTRTTGAVCRFNPP